MKITHSNQMINAADDAKPKDIQDVVEEKCDALEDDFDYILSGFDKMCREGMCDAASEIIDNLSAVLNDTISEIGDHFTTESISTEE